MAVCGYEKRTFYDELWEWNSFGQTAFDGAKNDLIVSTESATGAGSPYEVPDCPHFGYFTNDVVKNVIDEIRDSCISPDRNVVKDQTSHPDSQTDEEVFGHNSLK